MLMQMLQLTDEQINALPPNERQAILQLVSTSPLPILTALPQDNSKVEEMQ